MSLAAQRAAVIADVHRAWALEQAGNVTPDPAYADNDPSQYAEGIEAVSADAAAQADFARRVDEALNAAGIGFGPDTVNPS